MACRVPYTPTVYLKSVDEAYSVLPLEVRRLNLSVIPGFERMQQEYEAVTAAAKVRAINTVLAAK